MKTKFLWVIERQLSFNAVSPYIKLWKPYAFFIEDGYVKYFGTKKEAEQFSHQNKLESIKIRKVKVKQ